MLQGVIFTLIYLFYAGVVISSFVHTLHPHLFFQDSESEDEDLDYEPDDETVSLPTARHTLAGGGPRRRSMTPRRAQDVEDVPVPQRQAHFDPFRHELSYSSSEVESDSGGDGWGSDAEDEEAGREAEVRLLRARQRSGIRAQEIRVRMLGDGSSADGSQEDSSDGADERALRGRRERAARIAERERRTLLD